MMWNFKEHHLHPAAITDSGEVITYQQLEHAADSFAQNISSRSLVFSLCTNTIGALVGYAGLINNKHIPLLVDSFLDRDALRKLADLYRPAYVWLPTDLADQLPGFTPVYNDYGYLLLKTHFAQDSPLFDELGLLLTTSGSTGSPKLVRLTLKNLEANMLSIVEYLQPNSSERPITTLPMNYSYGLSIINSHLAVGATLLLTTSSLIEKGFWTFFKEQGATSFGGVPYTYEMLDKLRFYRMAGLESLKTMTQAGGKLSPYLQQKFAEYAQSAGIRFFVMYGQTEATARMSYLPSEYALSKCGSMGIAIPGGAFFLVDDNGNVVEGSDQEGELVYRGANVSLGYAECREDLAKGDENNGVLFTGDMARRDADGYYYITGRKKRFIKIFGNRVNLDEAEHLVKTMVPECACCGVDDQMLIYVTEHGTEAEIRQLITSKTGIHHSAFTVKVIPEILKNESGKIQYSALGAGGVDV